MNIRKGLVVGVDGTAANRSALRYAVAEARRTGATLTLVHVVPDVVPLSPLMPMVPVGLAESGGAVLEQALADAADLAPEADAKAWLLHGTRSVELTRAAELASSLVVGRAEQGVVLRLIEGDTATRVAARCPVPVVEVPADWRADEPEHGVVLVGVKSPAHAAELLGTAFAAARERSARLVVLHTWRLPSAYDDIIESRIARDQVEREGTAEIEGLLAPWRTAFPEVEVEVRVAHDDAAKALVEASREADLLVIVRRSHGVPAATHLGGTARALLRHSTCPVMVVPPTPVPELPTLVLEAEGELLKYREGVVMESNELGIILAVGPDGVRDGALELVAAEALRRGTGVELLHVVHPMVAMPSYSGQVQTLDQALLRVGRAVLTDAADRLRPRLAGRVPLTTELMTGPVAPAITDRAGGRDLVVLERREPGRLERLMTMSVSTRVAAHAAAPVVVVPQRWSPADEDLPVTVGVDRPADPVGQVEAAAAYAAASDRDLKVLFAMWLAEPYQDAGFVTHTRRQWTTEADDQLRVGLEKLDVPGARVTRTVQWARPADALVAASRSSSVLVLSRRRDPGSHGIHLGPVTRTVLHHAECPVLVVDRT